jgi:putative endonuclease
MTNNLEYRLIEHYRERGNPSTFAGRYFCYCLLLHEYHHTAIGAIEREKEIKKWSRKRKDELIDSFNSKRLFLNNEITPWPPEPEVGTRY